MTVKTLHCIRPEGLVSSSPSSHGPSQINASFMLHRYGSPHSEPLRNDPMIFDPSLTSQGKSEALKLVQKLSQEGLMPRPDIVLVSPLRRCMETAKLLFSSRANQINCEVIAYPLLRERLTLSSEVGSLKSALQRDFPSISFPPASVSPSSIDGEGMEEEWWYKGSQEEEDGGGLIVKEPLDVYEARLSVLRARLKERKEPCILIVTHWGVISNLTGLDLSPCQLATTTIDLS